MDSAGGDEAPKAPPLNPPLRQIHTHAVYYQQSFYPATIVLWNKLPSEIVLMDDLDSFKEGVSKINHQSP